MLTEPPAASKNDEFGGYVALSGATLVVGAAYKGSMNNGAAYIYAIA